MSKHKSEFLIEDDIVGFLGTFLFLSPFQLFRSPFLTSDLFGLSSFFGSFGQFYFNQLSGIFTGGFIIGIGYQKSENFYWSIFVDSKIKWGTSWIILIMKASIIFFQATSFICRFRILVICIFQKQFAQSQIWFFSSMM